MCMHHFCRKWSSECDPWVAFRGVLLVVLEGSKEVCFGKALNFCYKARKRVSN